MLAQDPFTSLLMVLMLMKSMGLQEGFVVTTPGPKYTNALPATDWD